MEQTNKLAELPDNSDAEFWADSETHISKPKRIEICQSHTRDNWMEHKGYKDNHDGTISCKFCPWGTKVAGYMKVFDEHIVDLRNK